MTMQQRADEGDVFAHLLGGFADVLAVPAAHGQPVAGAEPESKPTSGHVVDGGCSLGHRGGRPVVDRGDRGPECRRRGHTREGRQRGEGVACRDVGAVHRLVAELIRQGGVVPDVLEAARRRNQDAGFHERAFKAA